MTHDPLPAAVRSCNDPVRRADADAGIRGSRTTDILQIAQSRVTTAS